MSEAQSIWNQFAAKDTATIKTFGAHLTPRNLIGRVLLPVSYSYGAGDRPKISWLKKAVEKTGSRALDIGVRTGEYSQLLTGLGKTVFGIDIAGTYIDYCKRIGAIVDGAVCDIECDEIPGGPFDLVLMSEVIEHILDGTNVLRRIARAMDRAGVLLITTPNLTYISNRVRVGLGRDLHPLTMDRGEVGNQHVRCYTIRLLTKMCRDAGLKIDLVGSDGIPVDVSRFINSSSEWGAIVSIPTPAGFGRTIYVRAVKH